MDKGIITLVDVNNWSEEVTFGTCELCEYEGTACYQDLVFEQDGERFELPMYDWSWGDLFYYGINTKLVIPFASYIKDLKLTDRTYLEDNINSLYDEFCEKNGYDK